MTDLIEWANFVLGLVGAVGTAGIIVLLRQWYIDNHSKQPFMIQVLNHGWRNLAGTAHDLTFLITNRTSGATSVTVAVFVLRAPPTRPDVLSEVDAFAGTPVAWASVSGEHPTSDTFDLQAKSTRRVNVKAKLKSPGYAGPLQVNLMDEKFRRHSFMIPFDWNAISVWVAVQDRVGDQIPSAPVGPGGG